MHDPHPVLPAAAPPAGAQALRHSLPTIVIVGAGFGGLAAAWSLRKARARVIVIDRQNHHVFQPLLYQVATASLAGADIAQPIRHILRRLRNTEVLRGEVVAIDRQAREVRLAHRTVAYDWLVVATGATHNYFGHDEWAAHAHGLKSLADAQALRGRILEAFERAEASTNPDERLKALTFAIVGGGPTGVELAGSIAELANHTLRRDFRSIDPRMASVQLFEAGPRILPSFPPDLVAFAERKLEGLGVTIRTATPILDIDADGVRTEAGLAPSSTVIWTAGVRASPAGAWLGAPTDRGGRVSVDAHLRLPDDDRIFVIGDLALAHDAAGKPLPGLAQVARQQGVHVGRALGDLIAGREPAPFRYRDLGSWAIVGRNAAIAVVGGRKLRGRLAWAAWGLIHIALLVGFENRFRVLLKWLWEYLTRRRGSRLIVTAPAAAPHTADAGLSPLRRARPHASGPTPSTPGGRAAKTAPGG